MSNRFKFFSDDDAAKQEVATPSEKRNGFDLKLKPTIGNRFQIDYQSELTALGNKVMDLRSESVWLIAEVQVVADGYVVYLEIEKHEVFNSNELFNGMIDFSKLFNIPLDQLVIKLDLLGNVIEILNRQEVFKRWTEIKQQLLPSLNEEEARLIIANGDQQFGNPVAMLKTMLVYNLFFIPVYGFKQKGESKNITTGNFNSQLFQDKVIPYVLTEKVENLNLNETELLFNSDTSAYNKKEVEEIYNAVYKEAMTEEFDYQISLTGRGTYNLQTGLIKSCFIKTSEKANNELFFEGSYLIRKI